MPLQIQCPSCGKSASLPDSAAGKKIKCGCGNICIAPAVAAPPAARESSGELALQPIVPKPERKSAPQIAPMPQPEPVAGGEPNAAPRGRHSRRQTNVEPNDAQAKAAKPKPPPAQAALGCLLAVGVFYMLYHLAFDHSGTGGPSPQAAPQAGSGAPAVMQVEAEALNRDYGSNELAAEGKYDNKRIAVRGMVESVGRDIINTPYVCLKDRDGHGIAVQGMFAEDKKTVLSGISVGSMVVITGDCKGRTLGHVIAVGQ